MKQISWEAFDAVQMHVGRILEVEKFPEARAPSYRLSIDFGPEVGLKHSAAAIKGDYTEDDLRGRLVVAVTNFPPKQIAKHLSEVLVLAAVNRDDSLRLIQPDAEVELGARIR
jgi:tRNA-binding protein